MKTKIKRVLNGIFSSISDFFSMVFFSAAENHILLTHSGKKKFRSYTHLKRYQKKLRRTFGTFVCGLALLGIGIVIGPAIMPDNKPKAEVYIPSGRGDILLGNVSKNQATVIFKTLDAVNEFKPLATKAFVEVCKDQACNEIISRTDEDDYAVTHIIPVNDLKEGEEYFLRIKASDSPSFETFKSISSWGDGNDPIKVYAAGETAKSCGAIQQPSQENYAYTYSSAEPMSNVEDVTPAKAVETVSDALGITGIQNENHLQPQNKVQTIISWKTNKPANTILIYREGSGGEKKEIAANDKMQTKHAAILTTLKPGTIYYFSAKSIDEKGDTAISKEYSLHTPNPKLTAVQQIADNFRNIVDQIIPD